MELLYMAKYKNKSRARLGIINRDQAPTLTPGVFDIVWAAGIYEGEGSCDGGGTYKDSAVVTIGQKDPWLIYKLNRLFGGKVSKRKTNIYIWRLCGSRARGFLMTIYKFLSPIRQNKIIPLLKIKYG